MAYDAYDPCPCGSGKKFKFCCLPVAEEMDKVAGLQENHQTQATLQVLDRLQKTKPEIPWIYVTRAGVLLNEGRSLEARETLSVLLEQQPDHPFALALLATASVGAVGFEDAKPTVYKAFRHAAQHFPDVVGSLAMGIAGLMYGERKYLAVRQHLALAMRLVPEEDKQQVFLRLIDFDGDERLPYPLRGPHPLRPVELSEDAENAEEQAKWLKRAERSVVIGCYETAANLYERLAEDDADNPVLWANAGLCWAWDGDEEEASEALHRAARLESDFETALEYETLAQLLDQNAPDAQADVVAVGYRVQSVSKLLSMIDDHPQLERLPDSPDEDGEKQPPVVNILDREPIENGDEISRENVSKVVGRLIFADAVTGDSPQVWLTRLATQFSESAREIFESIAGEEIEDTQEDPDAGMRAFTPREFLPLQFQWHFPKSVPAVRQMELEKEQWQEHVDQTWLNLSQAALGDRTPLEAVGDEKARVALAATVYVFDAFCDRNAFILDIPGMMQKLELPAPESIEATQDLPLGSFSVMKMHRLKIEDLDNTQLNYVLNRALLLRHNEFLEKSLREALSRESCRASLDLDRAFYTLCELARDRNDREAAFDWIRQGKEHAATTDDAFTQTVRWEVRELSLRVEDPEDPELMPLAQRMLERYAKKIPQLAEHVQMVFEAYGLQLPERVEIGGMSGQVSSGGLWTPESSSEPTESATRKLWVPGED